MLKGNTPKLGDIITQKRNGTFFVMCITKVYEKPTNTKEVQKTMKAIRSCETLLNEQPKFKIKLRNDKENMKDYYYIICLDKALKFALQNDIKSVQIIWPRGNEETINRVDNIKEVLKILSFVEFKKA